ncbi:hypothetical protein EJB05_29321, partial [Eragrostis curvula]
MRRSLLLAVALVTFTTLILCCGSGRTVAPVDTIADSCNKIREFVDFDFCVSRLRAVPGSDSADEHGLLLITIDLASVTGAMAWDAATRMARAESDLATRNALEACGYLYWTASMPALRMYRAYVVPDNSSDGYSLYGYSFVWLLQAGSWCDAALKGRDAAASKMAALNHDFSQLILLVDAMSDL